MLIFISKVPIGETPIPILDANVAFWLESIVRAVALFAVCSTILSPSFAVAIVI